MARLMLCLFAITCGVPALAEGYCSDCGKPRGKLERCVSCRAPGYNPLEVCHNCRENLHETMRFCPRCGKRVRRDPLARLAVGQTWLLRSETRVNEVLVDYYRCRVVDVSGGVCSYFVQRQNEEGAPLGKQILMSFSFQSDLGYVVGEQTIEAAGGERDCVVREQDGFRRWLLRDYPIIVVRSEYDDGDKQQTVELIEVDLGLPDADLPEPD